MSSPRPELRTPWSPPTGIDDAQWAAIEREAVRVNERYLLEFIEGYAFCPFAKDGRRKGQTGRYVHRSGPDDAGRLLQLFAAVAATPAHPVTQVILPLVDLDADAFSRFCHALTAEGNARQPAPVLACAPLHPELGYSEESAYALVPLFRRAPDPTIQWVRLDGLDAIYAGRTSGTICPSPEELERLLGAPAAPAPRLYDRVCETNAQMARRLGVPRVAALARAFADDARRSYRSVLLAGSAEAPKEEACRTPQVG